MAAIQVNYRPTPAATLYREKLLLRRRADLPKGLVMLPAAEYSAALAVAHPEASKIFVKAMLQSFASAIVENAPRNGGEWHLGTLVRFGEADGRMEFTIMCASPALGASMLNRLERMSRKDMNANDNLGGIEIEYQFGLPPGTFVPIVFSYTPQKRHVVVNNRSHMANPDHFLNPQASDITSGFLNFLGTLLMIAAINPQPKYINDVVAKTEQARTGKLDEWLRWFYCLTDTGKTFERKRLLVDPKDPERFYYDYSPGDGGPSG
jgi:hypothetical protein